MKQLVSVRDLASRLGFTASYLWDVAELGDAVYRIKKKHDKKGKLRTFEIPSAELMKIQRRIVPRSILRHPPRTARQRVARRKRMPSSTLGGRCL